MRLLACVLTLLLAVPVFAVPAQTAYSRLSDCEKKRLQEKCCKTKWATNEATGELEAVLPLETTTLPTQGNSPWRVSDTGRPMYTIDEVGVSVSPISFETSLRFDLDREDVFEIAEVEPNSPAAAAGLKVGDIVTHINGQAPVTPARLRDALLNTDINDTVTLSVVWQGEAVDVLLSPLAHTPLAVSVPWTIVVENPQGKVEAHFQSRRVDVFLNGQHVPSEQVRAETDHVALLNASGQSLVQIPTPYMVETEWLPIEQSIAQKATHRGALLLQDGLGFFTDGLTHRLHQNDPLLPNLHVKREADVFNILDDMDVVRYQILFQEGSFFWWRNPVHF